MKRIITEEEKYRNKVAKLIEKAKAKSYHYNLNDFEIFDSQWRHKDWKCWCKGAGRYDETKKLVQRYIDECAKPYGERDLNWVHLVF